MDESVTLCAPTRTCINILVVTVVNSHTVILQGKEGMITLKPTRAVREW